MDFENQYKECASNIMENSAERAGLLATIASGLRDQDRHLGASICSMEGHSAAWGVKPQDLCPRLLVDAINDLQRFLRNDSAEDWNRLLALHLLVQLCSRTFFFASDTALELAQIRESTLSDYYFLLSRLAQGHSSADALLVSGFRLNGFLDNNWEPVFPRFEVMAGAMYISQNGSTHTLDMDSGFRSLLSLGDYDGAMRVSEEHEAALITPGLRGWSIASSALVNGDSVGFADASAQFRLDSIDRADRKEPSWSIINQELWAPYFSSRSHMATPCATPKEAIENLRRASGTNLAPTGCHVPQVSRYFQIMSAVCGLVDGDASAVNSAVQSYQSSLRPDLPSSFDSHVMDFLGQIQTLSGMIMGEEWIEPLSQLLRLLDRLPICIITEKEKVNIKSTLNLAIPNSLLGLDQGWEYRTLSSITDERKLHRILLAIFRAEAEVPLFSKICHGPIEYGKDIVVCREDDGRRILWMYSVKVGVLKKAAWKSDVRPQLEEIFQVAFDSPEIPKDINERVGVLVWNDHIHPYTDPLVKGWLKEQSDTFGRRYELMHIDILVNYVAEKRLGTALRTALRDEGLLP